MQIAGVTKDLVTSPVHRSHMQTHLVLCGRREFANQRVVNGNSVVQTPLRVPG